MSLFLSRTWAEINLDNIKHNYRLIRNSISQNTKFMAVVKADAYGHGAKVISKELQDLGADWFAVSNIEEALQLRHFGIVKPILILGYTPPSLAKKLSENNISQALLDKDYAKKLSAQAEIDNVKIKVHIKIDTGMSRIGFYHHDKNDNSAVLDICESLDNKYLISEGVFTHFATADFDNDENGEHTKKQFELFTDCIDKLGEKGINFEIRHCANSAATLEYPQYQLDMVRPGIILYGLNPSSYFENYDLRPAFTLKSVISLIKYIKKDDCVSYGRTFTADRDLKVATVPVGYADGYSRSLSDKGYVIINGKKAKILGRVCMDQMIVDVSEIDKINVGDEVLLFGGKGLSTDEFSSLCGTINYETVCLVGKRVPRVYYKNGKEQEIVNFIYNQKD
ncbi:MAG: alanine racemase [Acutalibacteraceae bacterium]|nr:alanine racemase [Acutalibacteraceae bacterium]